MQVEQKIADLGLQLARSPAPLANFVQTVRTGDYAGFKAPPAGIINW